MAARVWIGLRQRSDYLRRLAIVFENELRLKIVTELYMREMSASQFYEEVGGESTPRVKRHFKRLEETGWLRYVRSEGPGGKRRGGVEHFYRAPELAIFDHETWGLLPYSLRMAFSWTILKQMGERWLEALEAGTFDLQPKKHGSYTTVLVDQEGWDRILEATDALFVSCFEEQEDSKLRAAHTGEQLRLATVAMMAFESPMDDVAGAAPRLARVRREPVMPFPQRVSKLLASDLCMQILAAANDEAVSAKTFRTVYGGGVTRVNNSFRLLQRIGWLTQVGQKSGGMRRGGVEKFYRASLPPLWLDDPWGVPDSIRSTSGWQKFGEIAELAIGAMRAGTFDARPDRHSTWSLLRLDQRGWDNVVGGLRQLRRLVLDEQQHARDRLAASGESPILMTVVKAIFEAPELSRRGR